ncbi:hypothetical protein [Acinetobacter sp.]|uniref:hypothetical protein n=1 Tax=Acinetobacter sp. TaxID=472 RepID=UPI0025828187|nr:hypothetical protein [Acinetobacter sp.]
MKQLNAVFLWMMSLIIPNFTWASYVNHCLLSAKVLDMRSTSSSIANNGRQNKFEKSEFLVDIKVLNAVKHGRADSGCHTFINQTMKIKIQHSPTLSLRKGQDIKIESITEDAFPHEGYDTIYFLKED